MLLYNSSSSGIKAISLDQLTKQVAFRNPWFTPDAVKNTVAVWTELLTEQPINDWLAPYSIPNVPENSRTVGVVNAGNIPFVGLHDLLAVYISGHAYQGKNASEDPFLLPWIIDVWSSICPEVRSSFSFTDRLSDMEAVIATGSDNSSRYFEYYFSKYPHIIRKNRNGIAILDGNETPDDFNGLGKDIFTYYGLGCRNVAKLYLPRGYDLPVLFEALYPFNHVMAHHKYMNNFDHHHAVYLLKGIPFLQNNFVILKEDTAIASPLAVVFYEFYDSTDDLIQALNTRKEVIQCVAAPQYLHQKLKEEGLPAVIFGQTQSPKLSDYADGVDTIGFLLKI
ncbi:MAG: acyl-CoA reductase [Bacteroidota bacterium]